MESVDVRVRADLNRYLAIRSAGAPSLTADGQTLLCVTDLTGVPQAWAVPVAGGWPEQLTFADDRVQSVMASPADAGLAAFGRDAGGDERTGVWRVTTRGLDERPLAVDATTIHRAGAWTPDGRSMLVCANRRNGVDFDLYRLEVDDGATSLVCELDGWNHVTHVSPDGRHALVSHAASMMDADVWLVDLTDGSVRTLTPHTKPARHYPGGFGPNGRVFIRSDRSGDFLQAGTVDADGSWTPFGPHRCDADGLEVAAHAGALAINDQGRSRLFLFDAMRPRTNREVDLPLGVVSDLRFSPDGERLAFGFGGPRHPQDLWVADTRSATATQVTRSSTAGIDPDSFAEPVLDRVPSFDGLQIPVLTYRPEHADRPPVVVWVHGGPESQARPSFAAVHQYLVAQGLAVVVPNVRGSTGYGRRYATLDDGRRRMDAVADLAEIGRWVQARPDLDGARMAVVGGSYGGFMVLAALTTFPGLWAAGVDIVGIANLVTFLERTGDYRRALREAEYGTLAHDRDFLAGISPIHQVEAIRAPLLVIHGRNDPRVPVGEAHQIVERLRALDRPVDLLVFDDEGHGIVKLVNRRVAYGAMIDFLAHHLEVA